MNQSFTNKSITMKKYFGNQVEFTLEELKQIVNKHNQLMFYFDIAEYELNVYDAITICNWANGHKGRSSRRFRLNENGKFQKK